METAIFCLALNIYFEARNQPIEGQIGVTQVVLNRAADNRYPNHPCDVITQGPTHSDGATPIKHQCQFSWYCDGKSDTPDDMDAFRWALEVSHATLDGELVDVTFGATHYHATRVQPKWSYKAKHTTTIGDHIFYRWPYQSSR